MQVRAEPQPAHEGASLPSTLDGWSEQLPIKDAVVAWQLLARVLQALLQNAMCTCAPCKHTPEAISMQPLTA